MTGEQRVCADVVPKGTPNNAAILPLIDASSLPYLAPLSGSTSLRKSSSRNVFFMCAPATAKRPIA